MQAFKIPTRLIQTTRTLLIGDNLVFELHGNRGKSAYMFSFHVTIAIGQLRSQHTVFPSFSRVFKMKVSDQVANRGMANSTTVEHMWFNYLYLPVKLGSTFAYMPRSIPITVMYYDTNYTHCLPYIM